MEDYTRHDYAGEGIDPQTLPSTPWPIVSSWVNAARQRSQEIADLTEPDALNVGTVDADGSPSVRVVLMREFDPTGPGFYTNLGSRKALALQANPRIAGTLTWPGMFRAIRFEGLASVLDRETVTAYFNSRPWESRVGAWASHQSQQRGSREELEARVAELEARWPDHGAADDVPLPDFWGGYRIRCLRVELWAGRRSRLHDRVVYATTAQPADLDTEGSWEATWLQP